MEGIMSEYYLGLLEQSEMEHEIFESMCTCDYMELQCVDESSIVLIEGKIGEGIKKVIKSIFEAIKKFFTSIAFAIKKKNIENSKKIDELSKKAMDVVKSKKGDTIKPVECLDFRTILASPDKNSKAMDKLFNILSNFMAGYANLAKPMNEKTVYKICIQVLEKCVTGFDELKDYDVENILKIIELSKAHLKKIKNTIDTSSVDIKSYKESMNAYIDDLNKQMNSSGNECDLAFYFTGIGTIINSDIVSKLDEEVNKEFGTDNEDIPYINEIRGLISIFLKRNYTISISSGSDISYIITVYKNLVMDNSSSQKKYDKFASSIDKYYKIIDDSYTDEITLPIIQLSKEIIKFYSSIIRDITYGKTYISGYMTRRCEEALNNFISKNSESKDQED